VRACSPGLLALDLAPGDSDLITHDLRGHPVLHWV
jgi:hypothetical protein